MYKIYTQILENTVVFLFSACECNPIGSVDNYCDAYTGQCRCNLNYGSRNCSQCANGYFNFPDCACKFLLISQPTISLSLVTKKPVFDQVSLKPNCAATQVS